MAVKASDQITMTDLTDVKSVCRYYLLQSSTLSVPAKPTTNPPSSSWSKTEPTYTAGSTNSLYFTDLTVFSNNTFSYSDVSKSSSYEAAKTAYNKAVEAQNAANAAAKTATNFISYDSTNGLQVGNQQSGSWEGSRTQMTSDSFNILDAAGSVLAKYGTALIELGRNAKNAVIKLCSGAGTISVKNDAEFGGDTFLIGSGRIKLESSHAAGMTARHFESQYYHDNMTGTDTEIYSYRVEAWNNILCYDEPAGAGTGAANVRIGARYHRSEGGEVVADGESAISINESNINIRAAQAVNIEAESVNITGEGSVRYNPETDSLECYYNGTWNVIMVTGMKIPYLYSYGDEFTLYTGGWELSNYKWNAAGTYSASSGSKYENYMYFEGLGTGKCTILGTAKAIDLAPYNRLILEVDGVGVYSNVPGRIMIKEETKDSNDVLSLDITGTGVQTVQLDVSGLKGKYYIAIGAFNASGRKLKVYEVRLEV